MHIERVDSTFLDLKSLEEEFTDDHRSSYNNIVTIFTKIYGSDEQDSLRSNLSSLYFAAANFDEEINRYFNNTNLIINLDLLDTIPIRPLSVNIYHYTNK